MTHQRLNDLLRDLMLYEMHSKRVPERLGRHRPDGKRHTVMRSSRYVLAYPAARRILTSDVPQARAGCRLHRRKPFPQPLYKRRIGERHGRRRVIPDFCFGFALRLLLLTGRPATPAPAAAGRRFQLPLLEGAQHHEWRTQRGTGQRIVQHKILFRQRQNFVQPAAGVPQCINEQAFAEIGHL